MAATNGRRGRGRPALPNPEYTPRMLLSAEDTAAYLKVGTQVVRNWFNEGKIQTYTMPGKTRKYTTLPDIAAWESIRQNIGNARERANLNEQERRAEERRAAGRD